MADKKKKSGGFLRILGMLVVVFVVLVVAVIGYGFTLEKDYHFERSVVIDADTDDIHEYIGDLKKWDEWGPWRDEDPTIEYTYTESTTEPGDHMTWTQEAGAGSLEFTKVDSDTGVEYMFQWEEWDPQPGAVNYEETDDGKVKVTWSMDSKDTNFVGRYFMTHMSGNMTDMFDKGLSKLKKKVEAN